MDIADSIRIMAHEMANAVDGKLRGVRLFGSVVLDDFRLGWSDIDFIALADEPVSEEQAARLLMLRQELSKKHPGVPYFRLFEGVTVSLEELYAGSFKRLVYWGTSGQRITNRFELDAFSRFELARYGETVFGKAEAELFPIPTSEEMRTAVRRHYDGIRQCAVQTDGSLYSCGWLLDIARCIYTLRSGDVISKTLAGEWALKEHIFKDEKPLEKTLMIRKKPLEYRDREDVIHWLSGLGPKVQEYADVLQMELETLG